MEQISIYKRVFIALNVRDIHVVSRGRDIFLFGHRVVSGRRTRFGRLTDTYQLFAGEDLSKIKSGKKKINVGTTETYIDGNKVNLGVSMLSGLGGRHFDNFAGAA